MASVGIIGAGKVGSTLANEFCNINSLLWVVSHNSEYLNEHIASSIIYDTINEINNLPEYIFLTVQDKNIISTLNELIESKLNLNGSTIIHCSGFLRKDILNPIEDYGAKTAACHPYQTFYYPHLTKLKDVPFGIECNFELQDGMTELIKSIGGLPYFFNEKNIQNKEFYHLSAVAISNFLTPLLQLGNKFAEIAQINPEVFFSTILNQTIQNNFYAFKHLEYPLTGTIARQDEVGLKIHLESLKSNQELLRIFKSLTEATLRTSLYNHSIDENTFYSFMDILNNTNQ